MIAFVGGGVRPLRGDGFAGGVRLRRMEATCRRGRVRLMGAVDAPGSATLLEDFGKMVRGEWIGHECSFEGATGKLEGLPDGYIPEEFLQWGVEPKGFESNHSSILRGDTLYRKHLRIIPTVDHFSDHTDVEEENFRHDVNQNGFDYFDCGSYVFAPQKVVIRKKSLDAVPKVEICLRDSIVNNDYRIVAVLRFDFGTGKFIKSLQIFQEKFDMDYADGQFVEPGSGFRSGWGAAEVLSEEKLHGRWRSHDGREESVRHVDVKDDKTQVLLFPSGIHAMATKTDSGEMAIELGWMVDDNTRLAMRTKYSSNGDFEESTKLVEKRD
mmetsp:Transcript_12809/g.39376  ORF Transcript_12809/g.39376 Transcript_12809/m.39376 type:complete len:325 (-) Transcript_12809:631-1605(-)